MSGKASMRLQPAHDYYLDRYNQHVNMANKWRDRNTNLGWCAIWTFGYDDWETIRKITLHMFGVSTVSQLTDEEAIIANEVAKNIVKMIFDQIDVIGHSRMEIERRIHATEDKTNS